MKNNDSISKKIISKFHLNTKISLCFLVVMSFILGCFGLYNSAQTKASLVAGLEENISNISKRLQINLPEPLWNLSEESYQQIVRSEMDNSILVAMDILVDEERVYGMSKHFGELQAFDSEEIPEDGNAIPSEYYTDSREFKLLYDQDGEISEIGLAKLYITDKQIMKEVHASNIRVFSQIMLTDLILFLFISFIIKIIITNPLSDLKNILNNIASGNGDLTPRLPVRHNDEIGEISELFNKFIAGIEHIVTQVKIACTSISRSSVAAIENSSRTNDELEKQNSLVCLLIKMVSEVSESAHGVSDISENVADKTKLALSEASSGKKVVDNTVSSILQLAAEVENTADVLGKLSEYSSEIDSILVVIKGIAEQTNLLALNAAIEAARAGEQGRGFAVVADEVRTLAQRTQESTEEIQSTITQLQSGTKEAVSVMELGRSQAATSVDHATNSGKSLTSITDSVNLVTNLSSEIATAAENQHIIADNLIKNIDQLSNVNTDIVGLTKTATEGAENLEMLLSGLNSLVNKFKTGTDVINL